MTSMTSPPLSVAQLVDQRIALLHLEIAGLSLELMEEPFPSHVRTLSQPELRSHPSKLMVDNRIQTVLSVLKRIQT